MDKSIEVNQTMISVEPSNAMLGRTEISGQRFDNPITETSWNPKVVMGREQFVDEVVWTTSEPFQTVLLPSFQITPDNLGWTYPFHFYRNPTTVQLQQMFSYARFDAVVTVTVTGTKFHQGCLVAAFKPLSVFPNLTYPGLYLLDHVELEANKVSTATLRIPYRSPRSYMSNYDSPDVFNLGLLQLMVLSPLQAATGMPTSLPVSITWHAENVEVFVPAFIENNVSVYEQQTFPLVAGRRARNNRKSLKGQPHSGVQDDTVVAPTADESSVPNIGRGPVEGCNPVRIHDSPVSIRDVLKRKCAVGCGQMVNMMIDTSLFTNTTGSIMLGTAMDAAALIDPLISQHPAGYFASMYALARGSMRYTFTFDVFNGLNTTTLNSTAAKSNVQTIFGVFMPGVYITPPLPNDAYYDGNSVFSPSQNFVNHMSTIPDASDTALNILYDGINFLPRQNSFGTYNAVNVADYPLRGSQVYSNMTAGGAVVLGDAYHNQISMEIPFVSRSNAYFCKEVIPAQTPGNTTPGIQNGWFLNGWSINDQTYDVAPVTATEGTMPPGYNAPAPMGSMYSMFGRDYSPGTICLYVLCNDGKSIGETSYTTSSSSCTVSCFGAVGDDFRFGVLRDMPYGAFQSVATRKLSSTLTSSWFHGLVKQFGSMAVHSMTAGRPGAFLPTPITLREEDEAESKTKVGEPHGNTITVTNKFKKAANVTLPQNVTGDSFDLNASMPMGALMDKPTNNLGGVPIIPTLTSPFPNSTGIDNSVVMALDASEQSTADPALFGTDQDEMDICFLTSKLMPVTGPAPGHINWSSSQPSGDQIYVVPLAPSALPTFSADFRDMGLSSNYNPTLLEVVSQQFLYWSGSLRVRVKLFASGFHVGKLFVSILYHPFRDYKLDTSQTYSVIRDLGYANAAANLDVASVQGGVYLDLAEGVTDVTFEVPYKSQYARLDTGSALRADDKSSPAFLSIVVVNPLTNPNNVVPSIQGLVYIAGGSDFSLHTLSPYSAAIVPNRAYLVSTG
jgi:hypothetical protein